MFLFWRAVNLQMNRTVKYQGAFSRIVGFAGKRFLFSPPPPPSTFFFFCSRSNFRAITRLEALATQAMLWEKSLLITLAWQTTSRNYGTVTLSCVTFLLPFILVFMNTSVISSSHGKEEAVHSKLCKSGKWRPLRCIKGDCRHWFLTDENKQTNKKTYDWLSDLKLYR